MTHLLLILVLHFTPVPPEVRADVLGTDAPVRLATDVGGLRLHLDVGRTIVACACRRDSKPASSRSVS